MDLSAIRNDYTLATLERDDLLAEPLKQTQKWVDEAIAAKVSEPTAMHMACAADFRVSGRIVLLKGIDEQGLVWFTNYQSRKGKVLASNPQASLLFFWPEMQRQVSIEGRVVKVSEAESEEYFHTRPLASRLGALASMQSAVISGREDLEQRYSKLQAQYADLAPERPAHWGGYRLVPDYFEFWQGRASRLHDRFVYQFSGNEWRVDRLSP